LWLQPFCNDYAQLPDSYYNTPWTEGWASHTAEIQFMFGSAVRWPPNGPNAGATVCDPMGGEHATADSMALSEAMVSYWASFAKTGEPVASGQPDWPLYADAHNALVLDSTISVAAAVKDVDCSAISMARQDAGWGSLARGLIFVIVAGVVVAKGVQTGALSDPRDVTRKAGRVKGEPVAQCGVIAVVGVGVLVALLPIVAPLGCVPLLLGICGAAALLRRPWSLPGVALAGSGLLVGSVYTCQLLLAYITPYWQDRPDVDGEYENQAILAWWAVSVLLLGSVTAGLGLCCVSCAVHSGEGAGTRARRYR